MYEFCVDYIGSLEWFILKDSHPDVSECDLLKIII
jgi:hypothetical protein